MSESFLPWPPPVPSDLTERDRERHELFFATYVPQHYAPVPESTDVIAVSPPGEVRRCMFCGGAKDDVIEGRAVTFETFAHLIPEQLGNRKQGFDAECDTCNQRHGTYESDLGTYTLPLRASLGIKKKKAGYPTYKLVGDDGETDLRIGRSGDRIRVVAREESGTATLDQEAKRMTLRMTRGPFRPLHVYKSLAKVAVALMEPDEIEDYRHYLTLLASGAADERFAGHPAASLFGYWFPGGWGVERPSAMLMQRNPEVQSAAPSKLLVLRFANHFWQVPIFSLTDHTAWAAQTLAEGKTTFSIPQHPAPIPAHIIERHGPYGAYQDDLSSPEVRRGDEFTTTFGFRDAHPLDPVETD